MNDKIEAFAKLVQTQRQIQCKLSNVGCQANLDNAVTTVKYGKKYAKVDERGCGRFMVDLADGSIYGIKGYGQVHKSHQYGNVDTTAKFWWGSYTPRFISRTYPAPAEAAALEAGCATADVDHSAFLQRAAATQTVDVA